MSMSKSKRRKAAEEDVKKLLDDQFGSAKFVEKKFSDVKGEAVKPEDCEEEEIINFDEAKPDPKVDKTNYDRNLASYLLDVFDEQMKIGEKFMKDSKEVFEKYAKDDEINIDNKDCSAVKDAGDGAEPTCLAQFIKDFGMKGKLNPTTLLKIYAGADSELDQYEFNYILIKRFSSQAANPSDSLKIFKEPMKNLKTVYTYLDCDGSGRVSAEEFKNGMKLLKLKAFCQKDGESSPKEADFQPNNKCINEFIQYGMYKRTYELRPEDFTEEVLGGLNERYYKLKDTDKKAMYARGCLVQQQLGPIEKNKK